jgi:hypothetical protein
MSDHEREIELYDYIEVLLKYKWVILLASLVCGATAWLLRPPPPAPLYEADVVLMIKDLSARSANADGQGAASPQSSGFYETLARDDGLKQALLDSLGLEMSLASLDRLLAVNMLDPGIKLSVRTGDADFSLRLVNQWAKLFVARNGDLNSEEGGLYYDLVENEYKTVKDRLDFVEDSLYIFESDNRMGFMKNQQAALDSSVSELHINIVEVERALLDTILDIRARDIRLRSMLPDFEPTYLRAMEELQELDTATSQEELYTATREVLRRFDLDSDFHSWVDAFVATEIPRLESEIATLPRELGPNPVYVRLAEQLTAMRGERRGKTEQIASDFPIGMPALRELYQQRRKLRIALDFVVYRWVSKAQRLSLEQLQRSVGESLASKVRDHQRLQRNHALLSERLDRLSTVVEEARLSRARSANDMRILTQALEARRIAQDTAPHRTAVAAGAGLLVSALISLFVEYVRKARARRQAV